MNTKQIHKYEYCKKIDIYFFWEIVKICLPLRNIEWKIESYYKISKKMFNSM